MIRDAPLFLGEHWLRRDAILACLFALLWCLVCPVARAEGEGFLDNWAGDINIELRTLGNSGPQTLPLPVNPPIQTLREQISASWRGGDNIARVCEKLRTRFEAEAQVTRWLSCIVPAEGELRGRASNANTLGLKFVVKGNHVGFKKATPDGFPAALDPTVRADFDLVLRLTLIFADHVDGREAGAQPAKLANAVVTFEGTRFSGAGVLADLDALFGGADKLRDAERRMNAAHEDVPTRLVDLEDINRRLHDGTIQLAELIGLQRPDLGFPTPVFDLAVFINSQNKFVIQYKRFGEPPPPLPDCRCLEKCADTVSCNCAGAGMISDVNELIVLQREKPPDTWVNVGQNKGSWFVDGQALGAGSGETLIHRICRLNNFGSRCTPPFSFVYRNLGLPCSTPSSSGTGATNPCPTGTRQCANGCQPPSTCEILK